MSTAHFQSQLIYGDHVGEHSPPPWLLTAYSEFRRHLTDPEYPCFFGSRAEQAGHLFYTYCEHGLSDSLPKSLHHFIKLKQASEHFDTNLVVFLAPKRQQMPHSYYSKRFWRLLDHLHQQDSEPWPEQTPVDPQLADWQFCFGGEQFFIFSASPSYQRRKSRNLGDCQILLMQPRSSFAILNTNANGASARAKVRTRIANWDEIKAHPDLGVFGDPASREWKQYFLPDNMTSHAGQCPFHHSPNESGAKKVQQPVANKESVNLRIA